jgi:predicted transcriptional regulator
MRRRPDGALEREVLQVLWAAERSLQPREINEILGAGHAYTSVATVLTRLHHKGLVDREPLGRAFAYRAIYNESELAARRIAEVLETVSDRPQVLSRFIGGLSHREAKLIRGMLEDINARKGPS